MTTYEKFYNLFNNVSLPAFRENGNGEMVKITKGFDEYGSYYRTDTYCAAGYIKICKYYCDGEKEEWIY